MVAPLRILLVDDSQVDADLLADRLADAPAVSFDVRHVTTLDAARRLLQTPAFDAVILDLNLPDSQGLPTLREVVAARQGIPVIVVSGLVDESLRTHALADGADDIFDKDEANSRLFSRSVLFVIERNRARAQHQRLEALLEANPDAILVTNRAGGMRYVNAAALALFGRSREELQDERLTFAVPDGSTHEVTIVRRGEPRLCELRSVLLDWDGEAACLALMRDITLRRQAEELRERSVALEAQNRQIEAASRLKTEFLANMSHEIRTPMNAIIGLSHLLAQTRLDGEQLSFVDKVQTASRTLLGLINDVLDLSKIEAGEVELENQPFDLHKMLRDVGVMVSEQARTKHIELLLHPARDVPRRLRGDVTRVRQVLINLMANAVKFTERGHVDLSVVGECRGDGRVDLHCVVEDTGIGIAPDVLGRLFRPFSQADASTTRRFGGTGLGLSIVRQLVDLMGGSVAVSSDPGVGSRFEVTLPLTLADECGKGAEGSSLALEVLVCEAAATGPRGLRAAASAMGWHTESLDTSASGWVDQLAARLGRAPRPDALLLEWPAGEGAGAAGEALRRAGAAPWPPSVLVNAAAVPGNLPLPGGVIVAASPAPAELFSALNRALQQRGHGADTLMRRTQLEPVRARWLVGARLLIVDDSDVNIEVARRLLEREGALVEAAADGLQALERLRAGALFDAVLMDVQMPGMDGNTAAQAIRNDLRLTRLPVIALSAGAFVSERQRALDAGMDDFVSKPLDPDTLVRVVRQHVERGRGAELPIEAREPNLGAAATTAWPHIEGIDSRDAADRLGHDVGLFATMLGRLLREFESFAFEAKPPAADAGLRGVLAARLHKLRGSAGMLGAKALHRLAGEAELAIKADEPPAQLQVRLARLAQALNDLGEHARPLLDAQAAARDARDHAPVSAPSDAASVRELAEMLETQNIAALDRFDAMASGLHALLGPARFGEIRRAIDALEFGRALDVLQPAPLPA